MAHTKSQGSSSNGRDSNGQRLGVKAYGGEKIHSGSVIVRQLRTLAYGVWQHGTAADRLTRERKNWTVEDLAEEIGSVENL